MLMWEKVIKCQCRPISEGRTKGKSVYSNLYYIPDNVKYNDAVKTLDRRQERYVIFRVWRVSSGLQLVFFTGKSSNPRRSVWEIWTLTEFRHFWFAVKRHVVNLFANLDTAGGTEDTLDVTVDGELTGSDGTNHEKTGTDTSVAATDTKVLGDLDKTGDRALTRSALSLVDHTEHGVGGLRNKGGSETGNETRAKVDTSLSTIGNGVLVDLAVNSLDNLLVDDELGHGVGDLLEEDRTETRVESTDTLVLEDLAEAAHETASEGRLRDETNTSRLKRAQGDISEEFGGSGGSEVDSGSVVGSSLVTELVDKLLLEELITAELESTLKEVTGSSRTETGEESASTLVGNDLSEATNHTTVVGDRVKLDSGLDDIDRGEGSVSDGAADSTSEGESGVELEAAHLRGGRSHLLDDGVDLGRAGSGSSGGHSELCVVSMQV